jgi:hypothetical protein
LRSSRLGRQGENTLNTNRGSTLRDLFKRYRRPGDLVFAVVFLMFSALLLSQLGNQTQWVPRANLFAQPMFWPAVSLAGMTCFAAMHCIGSLCSPRIEGRWSEVAFWLRSVEYALWFMLYVLLVPVLGYLLSTIIFAVVLSLRAGYRQVGFLAAAALTGFSVVVIFKSLLQVKVPGGQLYEMLPGGLRAFMLTYF